jgi:hypothetical protein
VQARLAYLRQLGSGGPPVPPRYSTTAHNRALYDAIVVGDASSATELAARGRGRWNGDYEYEDDFLFNEFLHELFLSDPSAPTPIAALQRTVDRLTEVKEDPNAPEVAVCAALTKGNAELFDAGMAGLLAARAKRFAEEPMTPPELSATEQYVFVQGLALMLLARRHGIRTPNEYPTIPAPLLALGASDPMSGDEWQRTE